MHISTLQELERLLDLWSQETNFILQKNCRLAKETIELNSMYYEQKGNRKGVLRMESCLERLEAFLACRADND